MKQTATDPASSNNIGVFDINYDTGERYWSAELRGMLGVPLDIPAEHHLFLQRLHPDDRRPFEVIANRIWQPGSDKCATHDVRVLSNDGALRLLHIETCTSFRATGERDAVRTVGLAVDVTGRRARASISGFEFTDNEKAETLGRRPMRAQADLLLHVFEEARERPRILIIDDNRDFTHSAKIALERTGRYSVWEENEPARAHQTAQRLRPDLVLLDIVMPETDGGEVAARIGSDPTLHRTPVVFLTGLVTKTEARPGLQIHGHQFLAKPISIPELVAGIEENLPARAA